MHSAEPTSLSDASNISDKQNAEPRPGLVLDACVLMSGLLRPLLLDLAQVGLFMPLWSDKIGQEWQRNAARLWPIGIDLLKDEWELMQERFPAANMGDVTIFESNLKHTDRKDKHVAAVGIASVQQSHGQPISVLTWNLKDFSRSELRKQLLGLIDPDRLLSQWWLTQQPTLTHHIDATINTLFLTGRRQPEPAISMLKRDRLFRLSACYGRHTQSTT